MSSIFEKQLLMLKEAIADQNVIDEIRSISHICTYIEKSTNRERVIQEFLSVNLATAINDVICSQLTILKPTIKLIRHLMDDHYFRRYQFLEILKNIIRALAFSVQSDEIEIFQLEFFDIIDVLDVLMKRFLSDNFSRKQDECMQATFVCILNFIDLVLSHDSVELAVKNLMVEIYFHLLTINGMFKCISNSFELTMKVSNSGDAFLDRFIAANGRDGRELWLYKILQTLLKIFESFVLHADSTDTLAVKVFENMFHRYMKFVLEQLTSPDSPNQNLELFKLCILVLNAVLWTPGFSQNFISSVLKMVIHLNGDSMVFCLCKSSPKIREHTTYSMKIFLTALVTYSDITPTNSHRILNTFLECRFGNSIFELKAHEVVKNQKSLVLLYGCSFLRQRLSSPFIAHKVLENLLVILNHPICQLDDSEMWNILKIFAYCSNYAPLSQLEYAGVQKTSDNLLKQTSRLVVDIKKSCEPIDKYIISLAKEFCSNISIFNSLIFVYLSQKPSLTSYKVSQIIPTHDLLPLLISSDYNQVENAVKILQRKRLTEEELDFVVEQCFQNLRVDEVVIGATLNLIGTNLGMISNKSTQKIYSETIALLEAKQLRLKFSNECYLCIWETCAKLFRLTTKAKTLQDII